MATLPLPTSLRHRDHNATHPLARDSALSTCARRRQDFRVSALHGAANCSPLVPSIRPHSRKRGIGKFLVRRAGDGAKDAVNEEDDGPVSLGTAQLPPDVDVESFDTLMYQVSTRVITRWPSDIACCCLMHGSCCRSRCSGRHRSRRTPTCHSQPP